MTKASTNLPSSSFVDDQAASLVLQAWRLNGRDFAEELLADVLVASPEIGVLLGELRSRLDNEPGPRLLIDGLWFTRAHGGISRVWQQILSTWQLPGLISPEAPVALIDRDSHLSLNAAFPCLEGSLVDPLDPQAVSELCSENACIAHNWRADVFCSSWISSTGTVTPACSELALVHDCMPERSSALPSGLRNQRRCWLKGARRFLTVSSDTANDLNQLLPSSVGTTEWCHLAPASVFAETSSAEGTETLWLRLQRRIGLRGPFVLLPATSAVGSYKNPEFVADALSHPSLASVVLLLCGIAADQRCRELESLFPSLRGRVLSSGLSDPELAVVYVRALAVVIPSRIEGFGLPAIEAMAAGGMPLLADSRGLREAGGEAALRFSLRDPRELSAMLQMLLDPSSSEWLKRRLKPRVEQRLSRLNPDLFGLALLAQARQASC